MQRKVMLILLVVASSLGHARAEEAPGVDALEMSLASGDAPTRRSAAKALGESYPEGTAAVALLMDALTDDAADVRTAAADALVALGSHGLHSYRALVASPGGAERDVLVRVLEGVRRTLPNAQPTSICGVMERGHPLAQRVAGTLATGLVRGSSTRAEPIYDVLLDLLRNGDEGVRAAAAAALALRGLETVEDRPATPPAEADLAMLGSEDQGIRYVGVRLLAISGAHGAEVVSALGRATADESGLVHEAACEALQRLDLAARPVADALEEAVTRGAEGRYAAALALIRAGERGRVKALLTSSESKVKQAAAWALSFEGARGGVAVPVLAAWLEKERGFGYAGFGMRQLSRALARLGPAASATEVVLRDVLLYGTPGKRVAAARALLTIAPPAEDAAEMLCTVIERTEKYQPSPQNVRAALDVLIEAGPLASPAVPTLTKILRYRDTDVDRTPGEVLIKLFVRSHRFDQLRRMKLRAVEVLANLGPAAAPAKERLERLGRSADLRLRYRSLRALRRIAAAE